MTPTEYAELCESMIEVLEEHGHATGVYEDHETGGYCLLGAGRKASLGRWWDEDTMKALGFKYSLQLIKFNDTSLNKETAIDFVTERAKYWRNQ